MDETLVKQGNYQHSHCKNYCKKKGMDQNPWENQCTETCKQVAVLQTE